MNDLIKFGLTLVDEYEQEGWFGRSGWISNDFSGAADYIALVAYPAIADDKQRNKFKDAMLNASLKDYAKRKGMKKNQRLELLRDFGLSKDMIWRDIDQTITGGVKDKVGGGTKKLIDRFHAYHAFRAYDHSLSNEADHTFGDVLSNISTAYESKRSKLSKDSDPRARMNNLNRTFRQSRPVIHLTWGLVEAFKSKGWTNDKGQLSHNLKTPIYDCSWLAEALDLSKVILGLQLAEYEYGKLNNKNIRVHKFDPQEIVYLHL